MVLRFRFVYVRFLPESGSREGQAPPSVVCNVVRNRPCPPLVQKVKITFIFHGLFKNPFFLMKMLLPELEGAGLIYGVKTPPSIMGTGVRRRAKEVAAILESG